VLKNSAKWRHTKTIFSLAPSDESDVDIEDGADREGNGEEKES
jgi:hypothetical protein